LWTSIKKNSNLEEIIHVSRVNNFSEHHDNITKHTDHLEVEILIRNKFMAILEASGRILTKECEKYFISTYCKKKFKTSWVHNRNTWSVRFGMLQYTTGTKISQRLNLPV
jgi:hypothetical protein